MAKYSHFHAVYTPQDKKDLFKNRPDIIHYLDTVAKQWIITEEVGENNNEHYDIVYQMKKESRTDNETRRWKKQIEVKNKIELKCYGIDRDLEWQIGYNQKEGGITETSETLDWDLEICLKKYLENPLRYEKKEIKKNNWNVNTIGRKYVEWLKEKKIYHDRAFLKEFMIDNIDKIEPLVIQRFNYKRFEDWLELNKEIWTPSSNIIFDDSVNVIGIVDYNKGRGKDMVNEKFL